MSNNQLFDELIDRYYILYFNGNLVITNKFKREFQTPPQSSKSEPIPLPKEVLPEPVTKVFTQDTRPKLSPLTQLILDAKVPAKVQTRDSFYWANKYNKKADDELKRILKQGYKYEILMAATKLYYKAGGRPKTIANFILEGIWQGCYEELQLSLQEG